MQSARSCIRCLYGTSHPLGITIDDKGVCSGCRTHEEKDLIDWRHRWTDLLALVEPYRSRASSVYDCIVPVTGGQDSYFVMHIVRKLGLKPLLVSYNSHFNSATGIRNLARLRDVFDAPLLQLTVNPDSVRRIVRNTLVHKGSVYWHAIAGQTAYPVQVSVSHGIPLVIWGAHQGTEQVGMFSHLDGAEMSRRYRKEHDLLGCEAEDLLIPYTDLRECDIWQFRYPEDSDLLRVGTRGIYLSNYVRWDPTAQHRSMVSAYGYRARRTPRTFDVYDHVDSLVYMGLHDQLKLAKVGYGKVLDHASREIRHGRITRVEGQNLVNSRGREPIPWLTLIADWLGATVRGLEFVVDQHRNEAHWERTGIGSWRPRRPLDPDSDLDAVNGAWQGDSASEERAEFEEKRLLLIGRGFPY